MSVSNTNASTTSTLEQPNNKLVAKGSIDEPLQKIISIAFPANSIAAHPNPQRADIVTAFAEIFDRISDANTKLPKSEEITSLKKRLTAIAKECSLKYQKDVLPKLSAYAESSSKNTDEIMGEIDKLLRSAAVEALRKLQGTEAIAKSITSTGPITDLLNPLTLIKESPIANQESARKSLLLSSLLLDNKAASKLKAIEKATIEHNESSERLNLKISDFQKARPLALELLKDNAKDAPKTLEKIKSRASNKSMVNIAANHHQRQLRNFIKIGNQAQGNILELEEQRATVANQAEELHNQYNTRKNNIERRLEELETEVPALFQKLSANSNSAEIMGQIQACGIEKVRLSKELNELKEPNTEALENQAKDLQAQIEKLKRRSQESDLEANLSKVQESNQETSKSNKELQQEISKLNDNKKSLEKLYVDLHQNLLEKAISHSSKEIATKYNEGTAILAASNVNFDIANPNPIAQVFQNSGAYLLLNKHQAADLIELREQKLKINSAIKGSINSSKESARVKFEKIAAKTKEIQRAIENASTMVENLETKLEKEYDLSNSNDRKELESLNQDFAKAASKAGVTTSGLLPRHSKAGKINITEQMTRAKELVSRLGIEAKPQVIDNPIKLEGYPTPSGSEAGSAVHIANQTDYLIDKTLQLRKAAESNPKLNDKLTKLEGKTQLYISHKNGVLNKLLKEDLELLFKNHSKTEQLRDSDSRRITRINNIIDKAAKFFLAESKITVPSEQNALRTAATELLEHRNLLDQSKAIQIPAIYEGINLTECADTDELTAALSLIEPFKGDSQAKLAINTEDGLVARQIIKLYALSTNIITDKETDTRSFDFGKVISQVKEAVQGEY